MGTCTLYLDTHPDGQSPLEVMLLEGLVCPTIRQIPNVLDDLEYSIFHLSLSFSVLASLDDFKDLDVDLEVKSIVELQKGYQIRKQEGS